MSIHTTVGQDPDSNDVVILLERQHEEIRRRMERVLAVDGKERRKAFHALVHLLAVHETAEEEVVHPHVRRVLKDGDELVGRLLEQEAEAKRLLAALEDTDPDAAEFRPRFLALRDAVEAHARAEEEQEFPALRAASDDGALQSLAKLLRTAETVAPTRPHPGMESRARNLVLGPFAAVADRTRDAVRRMLGG
jgi:hemerythrin superfamily protein